MRVLLFALLLTGCSSNEPLPETDDCTVSRAEFMTWFDAWMQKNREANIAAYCAENDHPDCPEAAK